VLRPRLVVFEAAYPHCSDEETAVAPVRLLIEKATPLSLSKAGFGFGQDYLHRKMPVRKNSFQHRVFQQNRPIPDSHDAAALTRS